MRTIAHTKLKPSRAKPTIWQIVNGHFGQPEPGMFVMVFCLARSTVSMFVMAMKEM